MCIPVVDKSGKAHLMVNYYDMDNCINSTKFFEKIEISTMDDKNNVNRYIGKYVHVGGELNGYNGHIVDIQEENDNICGKSTYYLVVNEETGAVHRELKDDLYEITFNLSYENLE